MSMMESVSMDMASEGPDPRQVNREYLLSIIQKQLGITDDDMRSIATVKAKVREANIDKVLEN